MFSDTYDQIVNADGCLRGRKWVRSEIPKYLWMLMFTWGFAWNMNVIIKFEVVVNIVKSLTSKRGPT